MQHGLVHVVVVSAHSHAAALAAALRANGALHFFLAAALTAVVVMPIAVMTGGLATHALGFTIATARRVVK